MLAAASIKVMDALFGLVARNDAECCKRELLGRSWRRDWGMHKFRLQKRFFGDRKFGLDALGRPDLQSKYRGRRGTPGPIGNHPEHRIFHLFRRSPKFGRFPKFWKIFENYRKLRMAQSRGFGRPRRSRSQHWNPGGARCLSSASVAQMLAAASIKVMDALFGFLVRNDAEWTLSLIHI